MANAIFHIESPKSASIFEAISTLASLDKAVDNGTSIWMDMTPSIKESVNDEFSDNNHNRWKIISSAYTAWKVSKGYPSTVGVMTGALKRASGDSAKILYQAEYLSWNINESITSGEWGSSGAAVGSYVTYFNNIREIFGKTLSYIEELGITATIKYIEKVLNK